MEERARGLELLLQRRGLDLLLLALDRTQGPLTPEQERALAEELVAQELAPIQDLVWEQAHVANLYLDLWGVEKTVAALQAHLDRAAQRLALAREGDPAPSPVFQAPPMA